MYITTQDGFPLFCFVLLHENHYTGMGEQVAAFLLNGELNTKKNTEVITRCGGSVSQITGELLATNLTGYRDLINCGQPVKKVTSDFCNLISLVTVRYPTLHLTVCSIPPMVDSYNKYLTSMEIIAAVEILTLQHQRCSFVSHEEGMNYNGKPNCGMFVGHGLHLSTEGTTGLLKHFHVVCPIQKMSEACSSPTSGLHLTGKSYCDFYWVGGHMKAQRQPKFRVICWKCSCTLHKTKFCELYNC